VAEVAPAEPAKAAGDKKVDTPGKKGSFYEKHKTWIYGGLGVLLVVLYLFMKKSGSNSSTAQQSAQNTAAQSGTDPDTGYLYGSPADVAALGGSGSVAATPGPAGSTGATGATGAAGATGPAGNGLIQLTFAQAQKLAGKSGSPSLFYSGPNTSGVKQGKYANDKQVTYYTTAPNAVKVGAPVPK
jgi:hypothetical protein